MAIVKLKKLNRLDKLRLNNCRETLQKEKVQVDSNRLKLQNLIYEADHLKKEINKCFSFKSEDENIELVPMNEFMEKAPEENRSKEILVDEHSLRKARLGFELLQRKEYAMQCKELDKQKDELAQKTIEVKKNLDSLLPCLQDVKKATRPIQQVLNMPFEKEWEIQKLVRLLPQPLYMAYTKLTAYGEVMDKRLTVTIEGDEEEARTMEHERKNDEDSDADDSENELEDVDLDEGENRRKIKRRQSRVESLNQKKQKLFLHYPLSVHFLLSMKDKEEVLSITLNYLPSLGIVTVYGKFNVESNGSIVAGDVITQDRILCSIYENDHGDESPNPKSIYQLQRVQLNANDLRKILEEKKLGKPFKWAQRLCGISFSTHLSPAQSMRLCEETVPDLIRQIRNRLKARMQLYNQIKSLEIGKMQNVSTMRISCVLQLFVSLTFNEYSIENCNKRFIDQDLTTENDNFYRAIITRGTAKLETYICIPTDFPTEFPIFTLNLCWNDNKFNADNSPHIREIEQLVNSIEVESVDKILTQQLQCTMTSLDIFLETESTQHGDGNNEFPQEKNFTRCFKGRTRSRPYQPKTNSNITSFTH